MEEAGDVESSYYGCLYSRGNIKVLRDFAHRLQLGYAYVIAMMRRDDGDLFCPSDNTRRMSAAESIVYTSQWHRTFMCTAAAPPVPLVQLSVSRRSHHPNDRTRSQQYIALSQSLVRIPLEDLSQIVGVEWARGMPLISLQSQPPGLQSAPDPPNRASGCTLRKGRSHTRSR